MASFSNYFTILFLSTLFFSYMCLTQARVEWRFFSRVSRPKIPSVKSPAEAPTSFISAVPAGAPTQAPLSSVSNAPTQAPMSSVSNAPTQAPAPAPVELMSQNSYGLYGFGNDQFHAHKEVNTAATTSLTDMEDELLNEEEEEDNDSFEEMDNSANYNDNFNKHNSEYTNNYENADTYHKGYTNNYYNTKKYNNGNARNYNKNGYLADDNGYETYNRNNDYVTNNRNNDYVANNRNNDYVTNNMDNVYNKNGYVANNKNNGYDNDRQGMSDTRFVENGKYFYDVKNENNFDGGYGNTHEKNSNNEDEEYYKDVKSPYEFDTMEEYEKQGENNGHVGIYWP